MRWAALPLHDLHTAVVAHAVLHHHLLLPTCPLPQEFKTVMSALKSNNERWGIKDVTLVFRKPAPEEAALVQPQQPPPAAS
jgi:hypothetical protein